MNISLRLFGKYHIDNIYSKKKEYIRIIAENTDSILYDSMLCWVVSISTVY